MNAAVEYPMMKNVNDDSLKMKKELCLYLFLFLIFCIYSIILVFIYLPADVGTAAVRAGIPPTAGLDRDIIPLSELSRDLTVDGLGRAKSIYIYLK